ncbi:radical SAM protein [Terriglobus saanensis]|nr:radical SAM protein [Terriglobus saanensis]
MPTRTCTAACRHCGSFSSPKVKQSLEASVIRTSIEQAAELGFALIAFTGGEATLAWDELLEGIGLAHTLGLRTRLVTNAHWAESAHAASKVVTALHAAGLDELNISTGDEHARFVPLDRVALGIATGLEHGYTVHIMVEYRQNRSITKTVLLAHPLLADHPHRERIEIVESPWMPLSPEQMGDYRNVDRVDGENVHARGPCTSVLESYTVHPDGRVSACCGLGMELIEELYAGEARGPNFLANAMADAEGDLLKLWLRYKGPEKILAWASERDPSIQWENMYAHNCQACQRVYHDPKVAATILTHYKEAEAEIIESVVFDEVLYPLLRASALPSSTR